MSRMKGERKSTLFCAAAPGRNPVFRSWLRGALQGRSIRFSIRHIRTVRSGPLRFWSSEEEATLHDDVDFRDAYQSLGCFLDSIYPYKHMHAAFMKFAAPENRSHSWGHCVL
jgi:hypothetical protein